MLRTKNDFALLGSLIITSIVSAVSSGSGVSAQGIPLPQIDHDRIDAYIQSSMQMANIPGLALGVVYGDEVVYLKGYGVAGPDGRAVTPQTPFIIGSTSKSFTALAVMQLVEAGEIDLDAPVTTYLPWFHTDDAAASAKITVRNLLNQDSGLPTYAGRQGIADHDQSDLALENGIRDLAGVPLSQPAGQGYEYSNDNYNILGLIVQTVSGRTYEEYVQSAVFAPLEMRHSAATLSDPAAADIATGYHYWFSWAVPFDASYPRRMTPSGFLISSAEDMTHYLAAQLNGGAYGDSQILSPEGMVMLQTPGASIGPTSAYAMGWVIESRSGSTRIWHNGDVRNFHSNLLLLPDQHIGIVVLVNVGGFLNGNALNLPIEGVASILLGTDITPVTNSPLTVLLHLALLTPLLVSALWIAASYLAIRRWQQRGELPPHGARRFWQLGLPLAIDLLPVGIAWTILPAQFNASMEDVALFAPDAFAIVAMLTSLCIGWALVRAVLTLRPRRRPMDFGGPTENTMSLGHP